MHGALAEYVSAVCIYLALISFDNFVQLLINYLSVYASKLLITDGLLYTESTVSQRHIGAEA